MSRHPRSLALLSVVLILASWAIPSFAQAAPAAGAKAAVQSLQAAPLAALQATAEPALAWLSPTAGARSTAAAAPLAEPAVLTCPFCRPSWIQCGIYPRCKCCPGL